MHALHVGKRLNNQIKHIYKTKHHKKYTKMVADTYFGNKATNESTKDILKNSTYKRYVLALMMGTLFPKYVPTTIKVNFLWYWGL